MIDHQQAAIEAAMKKLLPRFLGQSRTRCEDSVIQALAAAEPHLRRKWAAEMREKVNPPCSNCDNCPSCEESKMNNPYQTNHQPDHIERTVPGPNAKQINDAIEGVDLLFDLQRDLEDRWNRLPHPAEKDRVSAYIRETVLCAEDELHEVLAEVHWKPWKNKSGIKDRDAYREELADVLHFVLDLYLAAGLTGKDFVMDYIHKHYKNVGRTKSTAYKES